jgi:multiple sugar transport system ATP-binding protein
MSAIGLENLSKVYASGVTAVSGLSLDVDEGEFVALVGPSGCGKTTALRMVAGLETITSGTVRLSGRIVNDVSPRVRDIGMVFQNYALYPHLTVAENIGFALANKGVPRKERNRRVREAAATLGLQDLLGRKPRQLSGGQRQRVAMGRAIVREPAVFLMDEPLSNLDAKLRVQMRAEILRVHQAIGSATLYVTHDQVEAMTMGDRIAVLSSGRLQQYGRPRDLYARPANLFVARFIGSPEMNLYQATLDDSGDLVLGSQRLALGGRPTPLEGRPAPLEGRAGRPVIVGVRPEDLLLGPGETTSSSGSGSASASDSDSASDSLGAGTLTADVRVVEPLGSEVHAIFSIDAPAAVDPDLTASAEETDDLLPGLAYNGVARLDPRTAVRPGERVTFRVDPARLHFFDPTTGLAIGWPGDRAPDQAGARADSA